MSDISNRNLETVKSTLDGVILAWDLESNACVAVIKSFSINDGI